MKPCYLVFGKPKTIRYTLKPRVLTRGHVAYLNLTVRLGLNEKLLAASARNSSQTPGNTIVTQLERNKTLTHTAETCQINGVSCSNCYYQSFLESQAATTSYVGQLFDEPRALKPVIVLFNNILENLYCSRRDDRQV